jgi:hypothetical protein
MRPVSSLRRIVFVQVCDTTGDAILINGRAHKNLITNLSCATYISCYKDANRCALRFSIART